MERWNGGRGERWKGWNGGKVERVKGGKGERWNGRMEEGVNGGRGEGSLREQNSPPLGEGVGGGGLFG